jgi:hypothetical protein
MSILSLSYDCSLSLIWPDLVLSILLDSITIGYGGGQLILSKGSSPLLWAKQSAYHPPSAVIHLFGWSMFVFFEFPSNVWSHVFLWTESVFISYVPLLINPEQLLWCVLVRSTDVVVNKNVFWWSQTRPCKSFRRKSHANLLCSHCGFSWSFMCFCFFLLVIGHSVPQTPGGVCVCVCVCVWGGVGELLVTSKKRWTVGVLPSHPRTQFQGRVFPVILDNLTRFTNKTSNFLLLR